MFLSEMLLFATTFRLYFYFWILVFFHHVSKQERGFVARVGEGQSQGFYKLPGNITDCKETRIHDFILREKQMQSQSLYALSLHVHIHVLWLVTVVDNNSDKSSKLKVPNLFFVKNL